MASSTVFDIARMPLDIFYHMLNFLPVDKRLLLHSTLANFDACFSQRQKVTKRSLALGLEEFSLREGTVPRADLRKLIADFHLTDLWSCSSKEHKPRDRFSCNEEMLKECNSCGQERLACMLSKMPYIESLDLRGLSLTASLLSAILKNCPRICCLKLDFASFASAQAEAIFLCQLAPKLLHLSVDNMFLFGSLELIFLRATKLEEAQVTIYPNGDTTPYTFAFINAHMAFLSLKIFFNSRQARFNNLPPAHFMNMIAQNLAKNLKHLRIKTNYDHHSNYDLLNKIKDFNNLRSLNLDFMTFYNPEDDFSFHDCWPKLLSLSNDFYSLRGSNQLLASFLSGPYQRNLESLGLFDCRLLKPTMRLIAHRCPNLEALILSDVTVNNLNWLFSWFGELPKLQSVYISFTIKDASLNGFNQRQLEEALTFPIKKISIIRRFLETHPSIAKLSIVNWPGLTKADLLKRISGVVAARKIKLLFKEY